MIDRVLPPAQRRRRLVWLLLISLVLLLVLATRAATTTYGPDGQQALSEARRALMGRTSTLTAHVMSYDAATAENDIAANKVHMTEQMQADYDRTLPSFAARRRQVKSGVKIAARISRIDGVNNRKKCAPSTCAIGVVSMTSHDAKVLVFVDQYATAKSTKNAVVNPTWEIVRVVRRDGAWVIAGMQAP